MARAPARRGGLRGGWRGRKQLGRLGLLRAAERAAAAGAAGQQGLYRAASGVPGWRMLRLQRGRNK